MIKKDYSNGKTTIILDNGDILMSLSAVTTEGLISFFKQEFDKVELKTLWNEKFSSLLTQEEKDLINKAEKEIVGILMIAANRQIQEELKKQEGEKTNE